MTRRRAAGTCVGLVVATTVSSAVLSGAVAHAAGVPQSVIVRERAGADRSAAERTVGELGGRVGLDLGIINGFAAQLPTAGIETLRSLPGVTSVEPDASVRLSSGTGYDPTTDAGSLYATTLATGAQAYWQSGDTGQGVDVALIDSGVVPVDGLSAPGKVVNGPDLSFDAGNPALQHLDGYGHGTSMAGIIAGRDDAAVSGSYAGDSTDFIGMAPDSRLVNIKVADASGASDVSQVIAALDWVVQHRTDSGLNIRVVNLSFGTDSTQPYALDPLAYAAEVAWRDGLVVVVSGGNFGNGSNGLADPGMDPYVIAAGAVDTMGTLSTADDTVAAFSSEGTAARTPDLVAPGTHIASLRDPGSTIDTLHGATATVGTRFFRGSGTSQAAAVTSGAAALVLSQRPTATPDEVKALLTGGATPLSGPSTLLQGAGALQLQSVLTSPTPTVQQTWPASTGTGSLELARGSYHVVHDGTTLSGETDVFGRTVDTAALAAAEATGSAWSGSGWSGSGWSGSGWSGSGWSGSGWSGSGWSGSGWSGSGWSGSGWSAGTWT
jgi:serine protease AprX